MQKKLNYLSLLAGLVFNLNAIADSSIPIGHYISELSSQTEINLPNTALGKTYLPMSGSLSVNSTASRSGVENKESTGSSGGNTVGGFSLDIINQSGQTVYVNLQGVNNSGAWGQACSISDNTLSEAGVDYVDTCVGSGGRANPAGVPISLYLAQQTFTDLTSFQSAAHFLTCPLIASGVTESEDIILLPQATPYQLILGSEGSCQVSV